MTEQNMFKICSIALGLYGKESQIKKIQEECLELALAISRKDCATKISEEIEFQIYDEVADVCIMMIMAHLVFDSQRISERIIYKLEQFENSHLKKEGKP